ncbi:MAG: hypothetical protein M5U16_15400 [Hyphomicrobium sp.]|nr:hypothetical protein [Hyphomicrobium sp.]
MTSTSPSRVKTQTDYARMLDRFAHRVVPAGEIAATRPRAAPQPPVSRTQKLFTQVASLLFNFA